MAELDKSLNGPAVAEEAQIRYLTMISWCLKPTSKTGGVGGAGFYLLVQTYQLYILRNL